MLLLFSAFCIAVEFKKLRQEISNGIRCLLKLSGQPP
jgi:hypothetical protein